VRGHAEEGQAWLQPVLALSRAVVCGNLCQDNVSDMLSSRSVRVKDMYTQWDAAELLNTALTNRALLVSLPVYACAVLHPYHHTNRHFTLLHRMN
jgi:hypothetical protein